MCNLQNSVYFWWPPIYDLDDDLPPQYGKNGYVWNGDYDSDGI